MQCYSIFFILQNELRLSCQGLSDNLAELCARIRHFTKSCPANCMDMTMIFCLVASAYTLGSICGAPFTFELHNTSQCIKKLCFYTRLQVYPTKFDFLLKKISNWNIQTRSISKPSKSIKEKMTRYLHKCTCLCKHLFVRSCMCVLRRRFSVKYS